MNAPTAGFPALDCACIVYRIARKRWIVFHEGSERALADAFFLRHGETGLSVAIAAACTVEQCVQRLDNCEAVLSLHVGHLRAMGLDVVPDAEDHANILGMPSAQTNTTDAERTAGLLARHARILKARG